MGRGSSKPVSELLVKWKGGDQQALQALMPLVYGELRRVAHRYLQAEKRPNHTLRSTELVHEAYLRLVDQKPSELQNQAHFFAVSARLMREILAGRVKNYATDGNRSVLSPGKGVKHGLLPGPVRTRSKLKDHATAGHAGRGFATGGVVSARKGRTVEIACGVRDELSRSPHRVCLREKCRELSPNPAPGKM